MINRTIKKKWINALRSGRFKKTTGKLRNCYGEYCVLGVLCEITGNGSNRDMGKAYPVDPDPLGNDDDSIKPFMGLSVKTQQKLAMLNDEGLDFYELANYISRNIKAVD